MHHALFEMDFISHFFELIITWIVILFVPGQDMALILRTTVSSSAAQAMKMVGGICLALAVHILIATSSLGILIVNSTLITSGVQKLGALYLGYLGTSFIISAMRKRLPVLDLTGQPNAILSGYQAARVGFISTILNPKVLVFFFSLFAGFVRKDTPSVFLLAYAIGILSSTYIFYAILTKIISSEKALQFLKQNIAKTEILSGIILVLIALRLLVA